MGAVTLRRLACAAILLGMAEPASADDAVRIATYNVKNLETSTAISRFRALADNLERLDADLIFLQEVSSSAAARKLMTELNKRPGVERYDLHSRSVPRLNQELVLLSRYRPERYRTYDYPGLSALLDRTVYADFEFFGTSLRVIAVHLKAGMSGYQDAQTRNRQARNLTRDLVRPALSRGQRVVVLGDFNDHDPDVQYPSRRRPHRSSEVFQIFRDQTPQLRNTDEDLPYPARASHRGGSMFDHALVDTRLAARVSMDRSPQLVDWASDHYPLLVDLQLGRAEPLKVGSTRSRSIVAGGKLTTRSRSNVPGSVVKTVSVRVYLTHGDAGDLEIRLRHSGKTATLLARGEASGRTFDRRLLSRAFQGEPAAGDWTLEVESHGGAGTLRRWELRAAAE